MAIFNRLYQIRGKHANMVRKLVSKDCLDCRNIDVFYISLVIGMGQNLESQIDDDTKVEPAKIDPEQMVSHNDDIEYLYELMMLSDTRYCPSAKERVNKALRYKGTENAEHDEIHFTKVMLGGLEYLYERIYENTSSKEDVFNNICDLVDGYNEMYGDIKEEDL